MREAFLIHVGSTQEAIKKKGYFKFYEESSRTFAEKRDKVKQLKIQLAELDETSGTSRKFCKNSNQTTVEVNSTSSTLRVDIVAELKQAVEAAEEATARRDMVAEDSTHTTQGTRGTRLSRTRPMPTPTQTSKG
jgi:hypothetical protein